MTEVYKAINAVMATMAKEGMAKERKNAQQGYNFRGIDDVYNALCGVMAENGLCMLPFVQTMVREERQTKNGGLLNYTILTVDFKLVSAKDGSHDTVRTVGEAMDSADKSANKAQSAALKYAALQVFMIPTEGDNDADATTHDVKAKQPQPREKLEGPFTTKTALRNAAHNFIRDLEGCGDQDMLTALLTDPNVQALKEQLQRDWPGYLNGDGMEAEYEPINARVRRMQRDLPAGQVN